MEDDASSILERASSQLEELIRQAEEQEKKSEQKTVESKRSGAVAAPLPQPPKKDEKTCKHPGTPRWDGTWTCCRRPVLLVGNNGCLDIATVSNRFSKPWTKEETLHDAFSIRDACSP